MRNNPDGVTKMSVFCQDTNELDGAQILAGKLSRRFLQLDILANFDRFRAYDG